ncbi:MAG: hypothetical protein PHR83_02915 [Paludibacter sp.]|nr:hypothetical protein [Paludibacter sp.]
MRILVFVFCIIGYAQLIHGESFRKINGVSFVSPKYKTEITGIDSIYRVNANWVAICPFAFIYKNSSIVEYNSSKNWWGDTEIGLRMLINRSKKQGLHVFLKPHCWLMNDVWAGSFNLSGNTRIEWEQNYCNYLLFLAQIAQSEHVELLGIGTELQVYTQLHGRFFEELISKIRNVYKGKLTYSANFEEFNHISFWNKLDYIGIDAYFPLSAKKTPSVEELQKAWKLPLLKMKQLSLKYGRKILFTEYGYRSIDYAAFKQWEFEQTPKTEKINMAAQINAYTAFYDAVWNTDFVAGGFVWKWYNNDATYIDKPNSDYTPQHKPVEKIIKRWYSGN